MLRETADASGFRAYVREHAEEGVRCPCCDRYVRTYRRTITHSQVKFLVDLLAATEHERRKHPREMGDIVIDVRTILGQHVRGGDYGKLRYWGLIRQAQGQSGHWVITGEGKLFLKGIIAVPRYAHVLDGEVLRFSTETITVYDAYREAFDLDALLANREGAMVGP